MGIGTEISWTHDTVNPWWGCVKVSPACTNCYAETLSHRWKRAEWGPSAPRWLRVDKAIGELRRSVHRARKEGEPRRVFIASMSDFFEDREDLVAPRLEVWRALHELAGELLPDGRPCIVPLLLTKRPEVMAVWAREHGWPSNAWAGTTVEDQRRADERIPHLLLVPAQVRFLSCEPLLEALSLQIDGLGWVIAGGESGPKARPSHPDWFRAIRDACAAAGVPFHFKQWGAWSSQRTADGDPPLPLSHLPEGAEWWARADVHEWAVTHDGDGNWYGHHAVRVGKKRAGRALDGVEHSGVPEVPCVG